MRDQVIIEGGTRQLGKKKNIIKHVLGNGQMVSLLWNNKADTSVYLEHDFRGDNIEGFSKHLIIIRK